MNNHAVVPQEEWLAARTRLLEREREFTLARDRLSAERRALPWVEVSRPYVFDTERGQQSLLQLFEGQSQLVVYHFMFAPDWAAGCKSCTFWADSFAHSAQHLKARDVAFHAVSRAPLEKLLAYRSRLGWSFDWVSSLENSFNHDFHVSFTPEEVAKGTAAYNYGKELVNGPERPGISVFSRRAERVFHTYSCYARGIDAVNVTYQLLDLVPQGRDEQALEYPMSWLRRRDEYAP